MQNVENRVDSASYGSFNVIGQSTYQFPLVFHSNYVTILHRI